jgi:hypothetical protein
MIAGNDPRSIIPDELKLEGQSELVFLGTGAFAVLFCIKDFVKSKNLNKIPTLWLVDRSVNAKAFWDLMQKIAKNAKTLEEFMASIKAADEMMRKWCLYSNPTLEMKECMDSLLAAEEGFNSKDLYSYFREIILRANIELKDWADEEMFEEIIMMKKPIASMVVCASNIVEFMADNKEPYKDIEKVVQNIQRLNPKYTVHVRTKIARHEQVFKRGLAPEVGFLLHGKDKVTAHLRALHDNALVSICDEAILTGVQPQKVTTLVSRESFDVVSARYGRYRTDEDVIKKMMSQLFFAAPRAGSSSGSANRQGSSENPAKQSFGPV